LAALDELLERLQATPLATAMGESDWAFPAIETVHVIAIALVIGTVSVVDLRLLGFASAQRPYRQLAGEVLPWTWGAFALALISGSLMFVTKAVDYFGNTAFRIKLALLLLAGLNMLIFETSTGRAAARWEHDSRAPWPGRAAATLSLLLWIAIVFFGRRIGFTMMPG
jgi:uncharacterized membrane protein